MAGSTTRITNPHTIFLWCFLQGKEENGEWDNNIHLQFMRSCKALTLPVIQASLEELRKNGLATMRKLQRGHDKNAKVYFPTSVTVSLNTLFP